MHIKGGGLGLKQLDRIPARTRQCRDKTRGPNIRSRRKSVQGSLGTRRGGGGRQEEEGKEKEKEGEQERKMQRRQAGEEG